MYASWRRPTGPCARCGRIHVRYADCGSEALRRFFAHWQGPLTAGHRDALAAADYAERCATARYCWGRRCG